MPQSADGPNPALYLPSLLTGLLYSLNFVGYSLLAAFCLVSFIRFSLSAILCWLPLFLLSSTGLSLSSNLFNPLLMYWSLLLSSLCLLSSVGLFLPLLPSLCLQTSTSFALNNTPTLFSLCVILCMLPLFLVHSTGFSLSFNFYYRIFTHDC
jgi:hypothetical protein